MQQDADFADIEQRSRQWMDAWMAQDRAALEPYMADDYVLIVSSVPQHRVDRETWLRTATSAYRCTRFAYEGIQMRRIADGVIAMSSITDFDAVMDNVDRSGRYFVTDLWRRDSGDWKICARYSSRPGEADEGIRRAVAASV